MCNLTTLTQMFQVFDWLRHFYTHDAWHTQAQYLIDDYFGM